MPHGISWVQVGLRVLRHHGCSLWGRKLGFSFWFGAPILHQIIIVLGHLIWNFSLFEKILRLIKDCFWVVLKFINYCLSFKLFCLFLLLKLWQKLGTPWALMKSNKLGQSLKVSGNLKWRKGASLGSNFLSKHFSTFLSNFTFIWNPPKKTVTPAKCSRKK